MTKGSSVTSHPPAARVEGAVKHFGPARALDEVSITLADNELLTLVGPSGCGKSTLLRSIAGLVALDEGRIELGGRVVDDGDRRLPPEHRQVGLVFQEHSLFPHLTVSENVAFGIRDRSKRQTKQRVAEVLELVALGGYAKRYPHELSGGERQRVSLARALAPRPALLLLDEPFASLDPNLRVQLRGEVVAALRATDTPAIFVTHDQTEALAVGDRVAVMRSGRIEQLDEPEEVFHKPLSRFVGAFMGEAAFLPVSVNGKGATTALGPVEGAEGVARPVAMVRPDDVVFRPGADGPDRVVAVEFRGATYHYTVRLADGTDVQALDSHLDPRSVGDTGRLEMAAGHRLIAVAGGDQGQGRDVLAGDDTE